MTKILFICEGNKIRSVMAAALYSRLTNSRDAISAGCDPTVEGTPPFPETVAVMNELGIDVSQHRSAMVTKAMMSQADRVIIFPTPLMPRFVKSDARTVHWDVADPYYQSGDRQVLVRAARDAIIDLVQALIDQNKHG